MINIKKGAIPKDTQHVFQLRSGSQPVDAIYKVLDVTDQPSHVPNQTEPIVYLRLNQKTGYPVDNFIALPLSVFVAVSNPLDDDDIFWTDGKSVQV